MGLKSATLSLVLVAGLGVSLATAWPLIPQEGQRVQAVATIDPPSPKPADPAKVKERNLKGILLALHNYHSKNGAFPSAAIYGPDGQPKLSWRVALLPHLGEEDLYGEFHLDEPWDSPHNKALIPRMPTVFQSPDVPAPPGETRFRGYAGPNTMFDPAIFETDRRGIRQDEVFDGTSNTVFITVAAEPVSWTMPKELSAQVQQYGPPDEGDPKGMVFGMADGSIRHVPPSRARGRDPVVMAALTRSGGEVIDWLRVEGKPAAASTPTSVSKASPGVREAPTAASRGNVPGTPTVEDRLRTVEDKLDQILKRLDGSKP